MGHNLLTCSNQGPSQLIQIYKNARTQQERATIEQKLEEYVNAHPSSVQGYTYDYNELNDLLSISCQEKEYNTSVIKHEIIADGKKKVGKCSVYHKEHEHKNTIILPCTSSNGINGRNVIESMKFSSDFLREVLANQNNATITKLFTDDQNLQILIPYNSGDYRVNMQ